jgi:hypothetical protein
MKTYFYGFVCIAVILCAQGCFFSHTERERPVAAEHTTVVTP